MRFLMVSYCHANQFSLQQFSKMAIEVLPPVFSCSASCPWEADVACRSGRTLSLQIWDGPLPCSLDVLMCPRKAIDFQFVQLFTVIRTDVSTSNSLHVRAETAGLFWWDLCSDSIGSVGQLGGELPILIFSHSVYELGMSSFI